jgi:hypothetical protein
MTTTHPRGRLAADYDAAAEASWLWHDIWSTVEADLPSVATWSYPSYGRVKDFEARIRAALQRAYAAGSGRA